MRIAACLVLVMSGSALADPFDVRDPAPDAPRSAHATTGPDIARDVVVDPGKPQRRLALGLFVGGVALVGAANAFSLYERGQYDDAIAAHDAAAANHAALVTRYAGTGMFVGGVAAIGVAAYEYFTADRAKIHTTVVAPIATGDRAGLALSGAF